MRAGVSPDDNQPTSKTGDRAGGTANMTHTLSGDENAMPTWGGLHHIALLTVNLADTRAFYAEVLGMEVGPVLPAEDERGEHCYIKPGRSETWSLHFVEYDDAEIYAHPEALRRLVWVPGALQHIAFAVPDAAAAAALRARLDDRNVPMSRVYERGNVRSFLFQDNSGVLLEATWEEG
jgi:catechol 2,3-dioxygenase-like lactoylglutathione lyase family enzyme